MRVSVFLLEKYLYICAELKLKNSRNYDYGKITAVLNEVMVNKLESISFDIKYYINTNEGIAQSLYVVFS